MLWDKVKVVFIYEIETDSGTWRTGYQGEGVGGGLQ